jgi:hypothetical protein
MTEPGKISIALLAEIGSWRLAFGRVDAAIGRELLCTAAEELWRALAADAALPRDPPTDARALPAVVDALTEYGAAAGIPTDDVQAIIAAARPPSAAPSPAAQRPARK